MGGFLGKLPTVVDFSTGLSVREMRQSPERHPFRNADDAARAAAKTVLKALKRNSLTRPPFSRTLQSLGGVHRRVCGVITSERNLQRQGTRVINEARITLLSSLAGDMAGHAISAGDGT